MSTRIVAEGDPGELWRPNVEEFGSVYEGLLEFEPVFVPAGNSYDFTFQAGDERAATGSHYTPDDLVQPLIQNSLDYLIADRLKSKDAAAALLDLRVADIACGSGHILLAAARPHRQCTRGGADRRGTAIANGLPSGAPRRDPELHLWRRLHPRRWSCARWRSGWKLTTPASRSTSWTTTSSAETPSLATSGLKSWTKGSPMRRSRTMPGDDKDFLAEWRKANKAGARRSRQITRYDASTGVGCAPEAMEGIVRAARANANGD